MNDPLGATGNTPLYLCLPPVWGVASGDVLNPHYSWDQYGNQIEKTGPQKLKRKRDSPSRRYLREILQLEAGSSGKLLRGPPATSKPAVEISAKGRSEPVVRNLHKVKPKTPLLGVSSADIPLQGASSSSIPIADG
jgi:hypothetical protein